MEESQFLLDEIQAATEIAHQKGKRVAVHAWGAPGIKTAIRGGVDSIEHGLLDDEAIEMMLEHDVFYVPTISATQDDSSIDDLPEFQIIKARAAANTHLEAFQKAIKAGVKIACGSDSTPTAEFTRRELEHMVKGGMNEMDALVAATRTGAELCNAQDELGTIEVGKLADLLVVSANPLENISNIREVQRRPQGREARQHRAPRRLDRLLRALLLKRLRITGQDARVVSAPRVPLLVARDITEWLRHHRDSSGHRLARPSSSPARRSPSV